jgi:hypothetical protein
VTVNADGTRTLTVQGQWTWPSRTSDCNLDRAGAGFAVAWQDPAQPGNSVVTLNGANIAVGAGSAGVLNPADDLVHATPPGTDSASTSLWRSGCGTFATPPGYNTGTWGPISHTYPVSYTGAITICPLFYDVEGSPSGGPSSASQIIAGATSHNADNSAQDNAATPQGNQCPPTTIKSAPSLSLSAPSGNLGGGSAATATLSGGYAPTGTLSFAVYGPGDATCTSAPVFTGSATVSGAGAYSPANFTPTQVGTYRWVASYGGDAANQSASTNCSDAPETVGKVTPSVSLGAPSGALGTVAAATATVSGYAPSGTLSFAAYGAGDPTCTSAPVFSGTAPVSGNGVYQSPSFTTTQVGTYQWVVSYAGDTANLAVSTNCGDAPEIAGKLTPAVSVSAPAATVGGADAATGTLSGGYAPSGTLSFAVYGPGDSHCSAAPVYAGSTSVSGDGAYQSPSFSPSQAGTYQWVASYAGDASNHSASTNCGDAPQTVSKRSPSISLSAPAGTAGSASAATATLSGGQAPTGTLSFAIHGPGDSSCSAAPVYTGSAPVSGDGHYQSPSFTPSQAGTYQWVASYAGDGSNQAASTNCGAAPETVTAAPTPDPQVTTTQPMAPPAPLDLGAPPLGLSALPLGPTAPAVEPVLGRSVALARTAGTVLVNVPGSHSTRPLGPGESVPVGTTIDARAGVVLLASARDTANDPQFATAGGGVFSVEQGSSSGMTELVLRTHKLAQLCAVTHVSHHAARHHVAAAARVGRKRPTHKVVNLLWTNDNHGQFSTRGQESVALVRGTSWATAETCDGTLTGVVYGQVVVHDHHSGRVVVLNAGQTYLARR